MTIGTTDLGKKETALVSPQTSDWTKTTSTRDGEEMIEKSTAFHISRMDGEKARIQTNVANIRRRPLTSAELRDAAGFSSIVSAGESQGIFSRSDFSRSLEDVLIADDVLNSRTSE